MKKIYFLLLALFAISTWSVAQTKGITYQAVLYDPAYKNQTLPGVDNLLIPYANKSVCLRFQITDVNNREVYIETQSTKTDQFGMVNLIIGQGNRIGGSATSFGTINWNEQANSLVVSLDNNGSCANFTEVSNQPFTASPFSMAATSIDVADYELIANKSNDIALDAASTVKYPTVAAIKSYVDRQNANTTPEASTLTTGKIQLAGDLGGTATSPTVPGLLLKANTVDVTSALSLKEDVANKSNAVLGTSTTLYPTQNAVKTYVDTAVAGATIADADATTKGKIKLAGDLSGASDLPTIATNAITSAKLLDGTIATADIANSAITYAKIQNVAADKVLGRVSANAGVVEEIATTGSGHVVRATSPTLVTPILGVATATSINGLIPTAAATGFTIEGGTVSKKLTVSGDATVIGTNTGDQTASQTPSTAITASTTAVAVSATNVQGAIEQLATSIKTAISPINITNTEVALPTKIDGKQLYAIKGSFTIGNGNTTAKISITPPLGMTGYNSMSIYQAGKLFRNQIKSFDISNSTDNMITGSGLFSEVYPPGTYDYVLEYFK